MNAKPNTTPLVGGRTIAALAYVVAEIRGTTGAAPWQPDGVAPALRDALKHPHCTDLAALTRAAIRAALDPSVRTPAPIALDGRHWHEPAATDPARPPKPARCGRCHLELVGGETRDTHVCRDKIDPKSPTRKAALEEARKALHQRTVEHEQAVARAEAQA